MTCGRHRHILLVAAIITSTTATTSACHDITTGAGKAAAVSLDSIAAPSIVIGDSLRDTLGIARPLKGTAYDDNGNPIPGFLIKYRSLDAGITIDTLTGFAIGDSIRNIPIRVLIDAGGLQTPPIQLFVVPNPDTVGAVATFSDTLRYSTRDTSAVISNPLTVLLEHLSGPTRVAVPAYLVSYTIDSPSDPLLVQLVDDGGRTSHIDTTANDGTAGRRIRLRPLSLTQPTDSVVVFASVRYLGALVPGSPVRMVLQIRPTP